MIITEKASKYLLTSPFSRKTFTDSDIRDLLNYALDMEALASHLIREKTAAENRANELAAELIKAYGEIND
jgi:ABC-type oligopeptide transport system substrate-binding subunit